MKRTVLLISANGGVGTAVARALLAAGDTVVATVSRPGKLAAFGAEFPKIARTLALDLADAGRCRATLEALIGSLDRLDAVVVCGAVSPFAPAETTPLDLFRTTMEINCVSHLSIYQAALPALRRSRGRLVFTGSLSGRVATPMMAAYCASKFALEGLADVMRQEAGEWGVEVILLQPGTIDTSIVARAATGLAQAIERLPEVERSLYGTLHAQMLYRVNEALAGGTLMAPAVVAQTVLEALSAEPPQPRYRIGADAEYLIEASRTRSDREIDALILAAYRSAPVGDAHGR